VPLGEPREGAILAATVQLLQAVGYGALTIDGVAAEAHASKATVYRRWRGKAELVKAALDSLDRWTPHTTSAYRTRASFAPISSP